MKRLLFPIALFLLGLLVPACKEIGPNIDLGNEPIDSSLLDTTYIADELETPQQKAVLLEDFTGVRCKNCPTGAAQGASLASQYPGQVIIVAQHSEFLAEPYPGDQDLRTQLSQDIEDFLAPSLGKPSAAIDRRVFSGESNVLIAQVNKWPNYTSQAISGSPPVNISIEAEWDSTSRNLLARVQLHYTASVTEDNRLSVMLIEDSIEISQLQPNDEVDTNYIQRHSLRDMFTRFNGDVITAAKEPKRVVIKEYELKNLPIEWNEHHFHIVAFVHKSSGSFEVLQVQEVGVN